MTFANIQHRILKGWWIIVITTAAFTLGFSPWVQSNSYQASIGLGVSFNSPNYVNDLENRSTTLAYVQAAKEFSEYLQTRFSSVEVQDLVSKESGIKVNNYNVKNPFYTVGVGAGGFISVGYTDDNLVTGQNFIKAIKKAYYSVVDEWNQSRLDNFKITPMQNFIETVATTQKPTQIQILPAIIGFLVAVLLTIAIPFKE